MCGWLTTKLIYYIQTTIDRRIGLCGDGTNLHKRVQTSVSGISQHHNTLVATQLLSFFHCFFSTLQLTHSIHQKQTKISVFIFCNLRSKHQKFIVFYLFLRRLRRLAKVTPAANPMAHFFPSQNTKKINLLKLANLVIVNLSFLSNTSHSIYVYNYLLIIRRKISRINGSTTRS